jgi:hypothetical protein
VREQTELRTRLEELAERMVPPVRDPVELTDRIVARHSAGRRRQWAAALAVVVLLVLVPAVRVLTAPDPQPPAPTEKVDIFRGPTRGSLAGDTELVNAIRNLPWTVDDDPAGTTPTMVNRHVVWAGDFFGGRWALVAGQLSPDPPARPADTVPLLLGWFLGPRGATAEQMTLRAVHGVVPTLPTALTDRRSGATVVVAAPDDRIEVSPGPEIDASGAVHRRYEEAPSDDGVALLAGTPFAPGEPLRYRVPRDGAWATFPPGSAVYPEPAPDPAQRSDIQLGRLRGRPDPDEAGDLAAATVPWTVVGETGVPPSQLTATILWDGDLPRRSGGTARASVVAVRLPSGAVYVGGVVGFTVAGGPVDVPCGSELRAATPVEQLVVVLRCDPEPGRDVPIDSQRLVVVGPPEAATARALDHDGTTLGEYPLADGVAVVDMPDSLATVEVLDAAGDTLDARAPMGIADLSGD